MTATTRASARAAINVDTSSAVSAAGSTQGTATEITSQNVLVETATEGSAEGVRSEAFATAEFSSYKVQNKVSGVSIKWYPAAGESWGAGYANNIPLVIHPNGFALAFKLGSAWSVLLYNPPVETEITIDAVLKEYQIVNGSIVYLSAAGGLSLALPASLSRPQDMNLRIVNRTGTNTVKPPTSGVFDMDGTLLDADDRISFAAGKNGILGYRSATGTYPAMTDGATDGGPA